MIRKIKKLSAFIGSADSFLRRIIVLFLRVVCCVYGAYVNADIAVLAFFVVDAEFPLVTDNYSVKRALYITGAAGNAFFEHDCMMSHDFTPLRLFVRFFTVL